MTDGPDGGDPDGAVLSRGKRRRLLRTLVNVGFGGGVASLVTRTGLLGAEVPIVYGLTWRGEDGPRRLTREVPQAWREALRRAFDVQRAIVDAGVPGVVGTFVVPGTFDDPAPRLDLDATPNVDGLADLEELLADIEYTINYVQPSQPDFSPQGTVLEQGRRIELEDDRVPAGTLCYAEEHVGTLAPATYRDGDRFFTTSNHLFGSEGSLESEHHGDSLYLLHEEGRTEIGTVRRGFPEADVVVVDPEPPFTPTSTIDGVSPSRVTGHFTKVGLADLQARGEPLEKVGAVGDHSSGEISGIDGVTCYYGGRCRRGQLRWGSREAMTDGDSGSVSYHPDPRRPSKLLVGSVNNARTWWPGGDFTWGTAAYRIYERHGYHF